MRRGVLAPALSPRQAFTLIELLIVIGIVAVLAALLVPVFSSVTESSRSARCVSNLKAQGAGIMAFVADNNYFPPATGKLDANGNTVHQDPWSKEIAQYCQQAWAAVRGTGVTSKTTIFQCPSETNLAGALYYTYAENNDTRTDILSNGLRPALMPNAAEYALVSDSYGKYYLAAALQSQLTSYGVNHRHNGHPNILYADGHAASYTGKLLGYKEDDGTGFYAKMWHWNGLPN